MIRIYQQIISVPPSCIDINGHANNTVYIHWMQEVAVAHSTANGWSPERYQQNQAGWFARRHYLDYLKPALVDQSLTIQTWVAGFQKTRSMRRYQICHQATPIFRAETEFVYFDFERQRPARPPRILVESFEVVADIDQELISILGG